MKALITQIECRRRVPPRAPVLGRPLPPRALRPARHGRAGRQARLAAPRAVRVRRAESQRAGRVGHGGRRGAAHRALARTGDLHLRLTRDGARQPCHGDAGGRHRHSSCMSRSSGARRRRHDRYRRRAVRQADGPAPHPRPGAVDAVLAHADRASRPGRRRGGVVPAARRRRDRHPRRGRDVAAGQGHALQEHAGAVAAGAERVAHRGRERSVARHLVGHRRRREHPVAGAAGGRRLRRPDAGVLPPPGGRGARPRRSACWTMPRRRPTPRPSRRSSSCEPARARTTRPSSRTSNVASPGPARSSPRSSRSRPSSAPAREALSYEFEKLAPEP